MKNLIKKVTSKSLLSRKGQATSNEFYEFMRAKTEQKESKLPVSQRIQPKVETRRNITGPSSVVGPPVN